MLPFPGSLLFFGRARRYLRLGKQLPGAVQIPLLHSLHRHEAPWGIRIPQSGWLHEARPGATAAARGFRPHCAAHSAARTAGPASIATRTNWPTIEANEDKLAHVLFSAAPDDMGLYGKPMARNAQIWTEDFRLLLDGPRATAAELARAAERLAAGGLFGYRLFYPPMRVGRHEVFWHRPLVAYLAPRRPAGRRCCPTPRWAI